MDIICNLLSSIACSLSTTGISGRPTFGELRVARRETLEDKEIIYNYPFEYIAKTFLKKFLGNEIYTKLSFNDIRCKFITLFGASFAKTPAGKEEFYKFICSEYLNLKTEPRNQLLSLHQKASKDILKTKDNINKCVHKIEEIQNGRSQFLEDELDYRKGLFEYYKESNISARDEIIEFIVSEDIYNLALKQSLKSTLIPSDLYSGYSFSSNPKRYDPDGFSDISNKFLDLDSIKFRHIQKLYMNDKERFYESMFQYIEEYDIVSKIRQRVSSNHLLDARKNIIIPALDAYASNKQLFLNLIPLQIEGLFYEYCLAIDISEDKLRKASIGQKLDNIKSRDSGFYDYEYFKFIFPVTRNRIAHGKLFSLEDTMKTAALMLLDLADITERITIDNLPVNRIILALKRIGNGLPCFEEDLVKIAFFMASGKELPPIYRLNDVLQSVRIQLSEDRFFSIAKKISKVKDYTLISGIKVILSWLKKENSALEPKCIDVFQEIHETEQILKEDNRASKIRGDIVLFDFFEKVDQAFETLAES